MSVKWRDCSTGSRSRSGEEGCCECSSPGGANTVIHEFGRAARMKMLEVRRTLGENDLIATVNGEFVTANNAQKPFHFLPEIGRTAGSGPPSGTTTGGL